MDRFRTDNTEGYDASELAELNEAFIALMQLFNAPLDSDDMTEVSFADHIGEELLASYDAGMRGDVLFAHMAVYLTDIGAQFPDDAKLYPHFS